jgi:hypothetical protein
MSDAPHDHASDHPQDPEQFDQDLDLRAIVWTTVGVVVMTLVSAGLMLLLLKLFNHVDAKSAAPRSPMAETQVVAPAPQLQPSPRTDMDEMHQRENTDMGRAAWIDKQAGTVRVPIALAIDIIAERGLPGGQASGMSSSMDRGPTNQASPGTALPAPGQGIGQLGPSAAAPISQSGQTAIATDASRGGPVPMPAPGASGTGTPAASGGRPPGGGW